MFPQCTLQHTHEYDSKLTRTFVTRRNALQVLFCAQGLAVDGGDVVGADAVH